MTTSYNNRSEVPEQEKWNLEDIYADISKWDEDYHQIEKMNEKLKGFDGAIHDGTSLFQYLKLKGEIYLLFLISFMLMQC